MVSVALSEHSASVDICVRTSYHCYLLHTKDAIWIRLKIKHPKHRWGVSIPLQPSLVPVSSPTDNALRLVLPEINVIFAAGMCVPLFSLGRFLSHTPSIQVVRNTFPVKNRTPQSVRFEPRCLLPMLPWEHQPPSIGNKINGPSRWLSPQATGGVLSYKQAEVSITRELGKLVHFIPGSRAPGCSSLRGLLGFCILPS